MARQSPMFRLPAHITHYDKPTIVLHWLTAGLVAALWIIGQTRFVFPSGPLRVDYISLHISLGVLLALVLVVRLAWRLTRGLTLPPDRHWLLSAAAKATHWVLYLLLITTVVLGMLNAWSGGDVIFNLFRLPTLPGSDRALHRMIAGWHALAANAVVIVAGFHAAAALGHHYVLRDDVLARMAPFLRREQPAPGE